MLRPAVAVLAVGVAESVTWTVKLEVPDVVGVPESTPEVLKLRPAGREPTVTDQEYGGIPPLAVRLVLG
jgi:hypothetical protein